MAYSTKADILSYCSPEELAQLSSEQGDIVDDKVVGKAITDADSEIDSYLAVRFTVPVSPTPARVNQLSSQIALYNLYSRRPAITMNDTVETNYNNAVKFLQKVSEGSASIGIDPPPAATSTPKVKLTTGDRNFSNDKMTGY
ncbi:MAG: DUF1320 domain-containing protein [Bacteroidetes bacterium]|nr:MAG: DUF1320 domain-containing protein [Bacteroidota bacterium]